MASGGVEAGSLAATSFVARSKSNFITRIAAVIATTESTEQVRQFDPRKIKQMTSGTTSVAANIIAWTAICGIVARSAVIDTVAGTAIGGTATKAKTAEQVSKTAELRTTTVGDTAGIAIRHIVARGAIGQCITRGACLIGKQVTQTTA